MEMTNKKLVAGLITAIVLGFAFGRYSAPEKIKIEKQQVEIDTATKDKDNKRTTNTDRDKKLKTVITETTKPDGTKTKTTEITEDTNTKRVTDSNTTDKETSAKININTETKEIDNKKSSLVLRGLVGTDVTNLSSSLHPIYGGELDKSILGPIDAGVWGLSNGTCGLSIGIKF